MILTRSLGRSLGALAAAWLCLAPAWGGPLEELKSVSHFPGADLAQLKGGEVLTNRGPEGDFARGISLEACYFVAAPVAAVGEKLLHWDPTKHGAKDVRLFREYKLGASQEAFQTLRLASTFANDRWLLDRTFAIAAGAPAGDLHLTAAEVALLRKGVPGKSAASPQAREARANDVWGAILRARSDRLAQAGIGAVAAYGGDQELSPGSEFRGLRTLDSGATKHFAPILNARPLAASGATADEAVGYWETAQIRGHTTLQLGVFAARKSSDSWQLVDCVYYPTDTYFMALDLFQLWPVEGGTLVWQLGFVSAPFRSYLGGVDRYLAGKQMTQETIDTIKAFRASFR